MKYSYNSINLSDFETSLSKLLSYDKLNIRSIVILFNKNFLFDPRFFFSDIEREPDKNLIIYTSFEKIFSTESKDVGFNFVKSLIRLSLTDEIYFDYTEDHAIEDCKMAANNKHLGGIYLLALSHLFGKGIAKNED